MNNKDKLPRFTCSHNPMVSNEMYIEVHGKERVTLRVSDWVVLEGEASEGLIKRTRDWYKSYTKFINS